MRIKKIKCIIKTRWNHPFALWIYITQLFIITHRYCQAFSESGFDYAQLRLHMSIKEPYTKNNCTNQQQQ